MERATLSSASPALSKQTEPYRMVKTILMTVTGGEQAPGQGKQLLRPESLPLALRMYLLLRKSKILNALAPTQDAKKSVTPL